MIRSRIRYALVALALGLSAQAGLAQERAAGTPEADPYLERVARLVEVETSLATWTGDRDDAWHALAEEADALREEVRLGAEDRLRGPDLEPTPVDPRLRLERERDLEVERPLEPERRVHEEVPETGRESLERLPEATRDEALERRLRTLREQARAEEIRRRLRERAVELRERRAEELREQSRERVREPVHRPR